MSPLILTGAAICLLTRWQSLPLQWPSGRPYQLTHRNFPEAFGPLLIGVVLWIAMEIMLRLIQRRQDAHVGLAPLREVTEVTVRLVTFSVCAGLSLFATLMPTATCPQRGWLVLFMLSAVLVAVIAAMILLRRAVRIVKSSEHAALVQHYNGFFYNNPDDARLWVPKILGIGWTINVAHPKARYVLIALFAYLLVAAVLFAIGIIALFSSRPVL